MGNQQVNLQPERILTAIHNNLNAQFFAGARGESKQLYSAIVKGNEVPFMKINAENKGEIVCDLALDHNQYSGTLNFSQFRGILATMLKQIAEKLNSGDKINVLNSEQGDSLFNIPGVVQSGEHVNILVSAIRQRQAGKMIIRLLFLDPAQFSDSPDS